LQIDELEASLKKNGNELQQQLSSCLKERTAINDSMKTYLQKYLSCRQSYGSLSEDYNRLQKNQGDCDYQIKLLNRKLDVCTSEKSSLQGKLDALNAKIAELTQQVKNTEGQSTLNQATLVDLFRQICEKNIPMHKIPTHTIYQKTDDDLLKEQGFYKDINWAVFCRNFNSWYAVKDIK